jgi:LytS/YehU family sensor histidine kinase
LLRAQLQPHFLFNTLNAVSELVHEDPEKADRMIGLLSDFLRATLDAGHHQQVPLDEEIALADRYLAIQRIRFGDRLRVETEIDRACGAALVPYLCLQPLVENAVRHGLGRRASGGTVRISAVADDARVAIRVEDDGVGMPAAATDGIGLANSRARLSSLYGRAATFSIGPRPGGGTVATIALPLTAARRSS